MKLNVEDNTLILSEIFSGICLRTEEGNEFGICMRDNTIEINVMKGGKNTQSWLKIDLDTGEVDSAWKRV